MERRDPPAGVQQVAVVLEGLGAQFQPQHLSEPAPTAAAAAQALGVPVAAIANSVVFTTDAGPVLVMVSGAHRADPLVLSSLVGVNEMRPAAAAQVRAWTGQPVGGVAPVGHPSPLRTLVDVELAHFPSVWCGAGDPQWMLRTSYAELLRITAGEAAEVGDLAPPEAS